MKLPPLLLLLFVLLASFSCHAQGQFTWHGFGTLGASKYTGNGIDNDAFGGYSRDTHEWGVKQSSKLAFQAEYIANDRLSGVVQFMARASEGFSPDIVWAYINYQATENLKMRIGRMRRPFFQYSDYLDVGFAYSWVHPPSIAYSEFGPFYSPTNTIDFYYQNSYRNWNYTSQNYIGYISSSSDLYGQRAQSYENPVIGSILELEKNGLSYRIGFHSTRFTLGIPLLTSVQDILNSYNLTELANGTVLEEQDAKFFSFGIKKYLGPWYFATEYTKAWTAKPVLPVSEGWYIHGALQKNDFTYHYSFGQHRITFEESFTAGIFAAAADAESAGRLVESFTLNGLATGLRQNLDNVTASRFSHILGIRYDFHSSAALKFNYELVQNRRNHASSDIYSLSVDFMF